MEAGGPSSEKRMRRVGEDEGGGADRVSDLPDAVLEDIISLLPTREGARTRILASRWRHLWRSAPLNLDCSILNADWGEVAGVVSRILTSHQGPGRCFRIPGGSKCYTAATVDSWLQSPAVDNLQELCLSYPVADQSPLPPLSESFLRFSNTLRVATIGHCHLRNGTVQGLQLPQLRQLTLEFVSISECSLQHLIAECPALDCLFINHSFGFRCLRINSISIRSIGVRAQYYAKDELMFEELIIENAPGLEKLLHLDLRSDLRVSVIFAPKLETLRCRSDSSTKISFGSTVIQSYKSGFVNTNLIRCHDIRLKKIVFKTYSGIKSQVSFVTFFVLNARVLESMILRIEAKNNNGEFLARHHKKLQLANRASRGARFQFTTDICMRNVWDIKVVHDLDLADPFAC